ncbi:MAG TPA: TIR domain-containing protein [Pyrinomonadaceae bacterium]
MNIFISQTKGKSREVALALQAWLRDDMRLGTPWMSEDIPGGANWKIAIKEALQEARFGVLCITDDNLTNQWIILETGILDFNGITVFPYAIDLEKLRQLPSPIDHLQAKRALKKETNESLVIKINEALGRPMSDAVLARTFKSKWKKLEKELQRICRPPVDDIEKVVDDFVRIFMEVNEYRKSLDFSTMARDTIESYTSEKEYDRETTVATVYEAIEESRKSFDRKSILIGNARDFFREYFKEENLRGIIERLEPILFSADSNNKKYEEMMRRITIEELRVYLHFHEILVEMLKSRLNVK